MKTLAGAALATFSYNCVSQQQEIANNGGVRWNNFASLLQSEDLILAVHASFQVNFSFKWTENNALTNISGRGLLNSVFLRKQYQAITVFVLISILVVKILVDF